MSPPLLEVKGQSGCDVSFMASGESADCLTQNSSGLKERNYLGLSDSSSVETDAVSNGSGKCTKNLNLNATKLRLGPPGSQSPDRELDYALPGPGKLDEKQLFPLVPSKDVGFNSPSQKTVVSGNKRGFSHTVDGFAERNWMFNTGGFDPGQSKLAASSGINVMLSNRPSGTQPSIKPDIPEKTSVKCNDKMNGGSNTNSSAPAAKAQVVGWPPIRSFKKNSLATTSKNNEEVDGKPGTGTGTAALFVKVSMDGAPYLRKVDLRTYSTYQDLSSALEKMFSCFTLGPCGPEDGPSGEMLSESKLRDLLDGSEYVLTYEDKDGDWMLVGDVPWEMFTASCKRLKIMKGSDAIGLAPRASEKSKNG